MGVFVFQNLNIDDFEEYYFQLEWKMANRGHPLLLPDQVIMPTEKMRLQTLTEILEAKNVLWREECIKLRGQMKARKQECKKTSQPLFKTRKQEKREIWR